MTNAHKILDRNFEGSRPLGKPVSRWEDNVKMDLKEIDVRAWSGFRWSRMEFIDGLL
jgi:hypothetical protein